MRRQPHSGEVLITRTNSIHKIDRVYNVALAAPEREKINLPPTKSALHRTRLRVLDHKNFSVLFFYKPDRATASGLP
jgi:hypothetical protein